MIVAIDVGRHQVKAVADQKELSFKSAVGGWHQRKLSQGGRYEVNVDGEQYFVADLVRESYTPREMASESKIHTETKVLFLTALSLLANSNKDLRIVTGLPVGQHTPEEKTRMVKLLTGQHYVSVGDKTQIFNLANIDIVPESGGAFWDEVLNDMGIVVKASLLKNTVRVVDIGSRTINYCTMYEGDYLDRDSGTLNYGTIELENMGEHLPEPAAYEAFARRVAADLFKKWLNYSPLKDTILLSGGGSINLSGYLKIHFHHVLNASNPVFGNVRGFYKMAMCKYA